MSLSANQRSALNGVAVHLRYGDRWQFAFLPLAIASNANASSLANAVGDVLAETTVPATTQEGALNAVAASLVDRYARESVRLVREVAR